MYTFYPVWIRNEFILCVNSFLNYAPMYIVQKLVYGQIRFNFNSIFFYMAPGHNNSCLKAIEAMA